MTSSRTAAAAQEWISHDPDPQTAAELAALSDEELDERFAQPLTFGTAGLRGPLRGGPNGMNLAVVLRTTLGGRQGAQGPWPGRPRRGGRPRRPPRLRGLRPRRRRSPCRPRISRHTDVRGGADAGGGVRRAAHAARRRASRSPHRTTRPSDNGYKVYFDGGFPIVPPADREIEARHRRRPARRRDPRGSPSTLSGVEEFSTTSSARPTSGTRTGRCGWR